MAVSESRQHFVCDSLLFCELAQLRRNEINLWSIVFDFKEKHKQNRFSYHAPTTAMPYSSSISIKFLFDIRFFYPVFFSFLENFSLLSSVATIGMAICLCKQNWQTDWNCTLSRCSRRFFAATASEQNLLCNKIDSIHTLFLFNFQIDAANGVRGKKSKK